MKTSAPLPIQQPTPSASASSSQKPDGLREVARQFETIFAQMMLNTMRSASFGDDLMGDGGVYRDLYDSEMAKHLSAGPGLGIAELLVRQFGGGDQVSAGFDALKMPVGRVQAARAYAPVEAYSGTREAFIDRIQPHAEAAARELGVPVQYLMAQAALESGWGRAAPGNNLFGIKADRGWQGQSHQSATHEFVDGAMQGQSARFRSYGSEAESFANYVDFLRENPRYREALGQAGDGRQFIQHLQSAGYATDPDYAEKVIALAESGPIRAASQERDA